MDKWFRRIFAGSVVAVSIVAGAQSPAASPERLLVVPADSGPKTASGNEWKILGDQSGGRLAIMEIKVPTADKFREPHIHTREEEGWYVIEGELAFQAGNESASAGPGTLVWAPRNVAHRYHVAKAPARYLLIFSPAGMEGLFKDVDEIRHLGVGTPEYAKELERRRAKYGVRAGQLPNREKP
jgi:quercetin dioxygenase-like cupin family protein